MSVEYEQYPFPKGRLPSGWMETTVGEVLLEIRSGYSSGKHNQSGQGISHLRPMNVSPVGEISMEDVRYVSPKVSSLRLAKNDVLFTNTSSTVWVGKTALVENLGDWGFSNHMTRLRVADGISPEFVARQLHYLCLCGYFAFHCKKHVNQSSISGKQLAENVPFLLPPAQEQKRIVKKLRRLLDRERKLHQQLEALPALIQQYRAAVLEAACTGRLVPTEAEIARKECRDFEPASVLLERILVERRAKWEADQLTKMRAAGKEPKDDQWKERYPRPEKIESKPSYKIPEGWVWGALDEMCYKVQDGTHSSPKQQSSAAKYKYITAKNIKTWGLDLSHVTYVDEKIHRNIYERCNPEKGDVLYIKDGATAGIAVVNPLKEEFSLLSSVALFKTMRFGLLGDFLAIYLNSPSGYVRMTEMVSGTAILRLTLRKLRKSAIPLPPLAEQQRIVAEIKYRFDVLVDVEEQIKTALKEVQKLRTSFLHNAVSGKLVSQSSYDSPALQLLEQIAVSRQMHQENRKKEIRKSMKKKSQIPISKRELLEVLSENSDGLTPDQLMDKCGYTSDEVPAFYKALRSVEREIQVTRPERKVVILKRKRS